MIYEKIVFLVIGILMIGCENRNNVTVPNSNPIKLDSGLYVKEYCLGVGSAESVRYLFIQCTAEGQFIKGLPCSHPDGKTMTGTAVISDIDSSEEDIYKNLREKYGANSDFGLYLKLRDNYESK